MEVRPPTFDAYQYESFPMLLRVYGGPSSQLVLKRFSLDWHTYLSSSLNYIVVMVRGASERARARPHVALRGALTHARPRPRRGRGGA